MIAGELILKNSWLLIKGTRAFIVNKIKEVMTAQGAWDFFFGRWNILELIMLVAQFMNIWKTIRLYTLKGEFMVCKIYLQKRKQSHNLKFKMLKTNSKWWLHFQERAIEQSGRGP